MLGDIFCFSKCLHFVPVCGSYSTSPAFLFFIFIFLFCFGYQHRKSSKPSLLAYDEFVTTAVLMWRMIPSRCPVQFFFICRKYKDRREASGRRTKNTRYLCHHPENEPQIRSNLVVKGVSLDLCTFEWVSQALIQCPKSPNRY